MGGCAWLPWGGMRGWRGACVVHGFLGGVHGCPGGMHGWQGGHAWFPRGGGVWFAGGHAWLVGGHTSFPGGVRGWGVYVVDRGGMHGEGEGGVHGEGGVCVAKLELPQLLALHLSENL